MAILQIKYKDKIIETIVDADVYEWASKKHWKYHKGYIIRRDKRGGGCKDIPLHRDIMNPPKGMQVDHINNDPLDNRRCNLRICTKAQNQQNKPKAKGDYSSKYKGVSITKRHIKPWKATIKGRIHIGYYSTEEDAARAYDAKAEELFGEFAKLNFE